MNTTDTIEPIAIIGIGCRLPGDLDSPAKFWDALLSKKIVRSERVPKSRFDIDAYYHPNLERPGSFTTLGGFFLNEDFHQFDSAFFGVSPVEAMWMDPQQKKLLEVVYESIESAGLTLDELAGSLTGTYVGNFTADWQQMLMREADFRHNYAATGVDPGLLSSRISHCLNLRGPSLTVNTACSSSVYAVHNACNALRQGECNAAIVAGTNLIMTVDQHINTAKLGVLSDTSQCHTFDASADGYARGEGVGSFVLKRLSDAIANNDPIRAVIRGTAVNSNGKEPGAGITHPNVEGQRRVIQAAYRQAGNLNPLDTGYFECHGTGTPVGDPLEVQALSSAMNVNRAPGSEPLLIGAVKPNIGHSEAASGMAAMMKVALAVESGTIPATAAYTTPSPRIKFDEWQVRVSAEAEAWPQGLSVRRASINSFGYGGTNGHVIIEAVDSVAPQYVKKLHGESATEQQIRKSILVFSANSKAALDGNLSKFQDYLQIRKPAAADLAHTLSSRRSRFGSRAFAVLPEGDSLIDLKEALRFGEAEAEVNDAAMFVFTGQGSQWAGMGADLIRRYPLYRETVQEMDRVLKSLDDGPSWTIESALDGSSSELDINHASLSQTLCTAVQVALTTLLADWNIRPKCVVGHSSGEIAAAHAAGRLTAAAAITAAYYRGVIATLSSGGGAMLAAGIGADEAKVYIKDTGLSIACYNSPSSVTISGAEEEIIHASKLMLKDGVFNRILRTGGCAYHTSFMEKHADLYERQLTNAAEEQQDGLQETLPVWISSVTGEPMPNTVAPGYWRENLVKPVRFDTALELAIRSTKTNRIVELGPHSALAGPVRQVLAKETSRTIQYHSTLARGKDGEDCLLQLAGNLFLGNFPVDLERVNETSSELNRVLVDLPTYTWDYGNTTTPCAEPRWSVEQRSTHQLRHDILGRIVPGGVGFEPQWRNVLRRKDLPWLQEHQLGEEVIFPASGYWEMAIEAFRQANPDDTSNCYKLKNFGIATALVIPESDDGAETLFSLKKRGSVQEFKVYSFSHGVWKEHASGIVSGAHSSPDVDIIPTTAPLNQKTAGQRWYEAFSKIGFRYGPGFQGIQAVKGNSSIPQVTATVDVHQTSGVVEGESQYLLHPRTLDCCMQLGIAAIYNAQLEDVSCGYVPVNAEEITIWRPGSILSGGDIGNANAIVTEKTLRTAIVDVQLTMGGSKLLDIKNLQCTTYEAVLPQTIQTQPSVPLWTSCWKPDIADILSEKKPMDIDIATAVELIYFKHSTTSALELVGASQSLKDLLQLYIVAPGSYDVCKISGSSSEQASQEESQDGLVNWDSLKENDISYDMLILRSTDVEVKETLGPLKRAADADTGDAPADVPEPSVYNFLDGKLILSPALLNILQPTTTLPSLETPVVNGLKNGLTNGHTNGHAKQAELPALKNGLTNGHTNGHASKKDEQPALKNGLTNGHKLVNGNTNGNTNGYHSEPDEEHLTDLETVIMVYNGTLDLFHNYLIEAGKLRGLNLQPLSLVNIEAAPIGSKFILVPDLRDRSFLTSLSAPELQAIQFLILQPKNKVLWVTNGALDTGKRPEYGAVLGLLRCVRAENAGTDVTVVDVDLDTTWDVLCDGLFAELRSTGDEKEIALKGGKRYINRLQPIRSLVEGGEDAADSARDCHYSAVLRKDIGTNPIEFEAITLPDLLGGHLEVEVKVIGVNTEDVTALNGNGDTYLAGMEYAGTVTRVSPEISHFKPGDDVFGISAGGFGNYRQVPASLCHKIRKESHTEAASLLAAYTTALYALFDVARVSARERLLVTSDTGAAGLAAIHLADIHDVEVFVIASSGEERDVLLKDYDVSQDHVFLNNEELLSSSAEFDVVFSAGGSTEIDFHRRILPFGRIVELSREGHSPRPTVKCQSYSSFTLGDILKAKPALLESVISRVVDLYNDDLLRPIVSIANFNISDLPIAIRTSGSMMVQAKHVVQVRSSKELTVPKPLPVAKLSPEASYLLVGCLGGLGRVLTSWMMDRGARRFVFLQRSGTDRPEAKELVDSMVLKGMTVDVVRGDVSVASDVAKVRAAAAGPIKGVVQAAMVLRDGLFENMKIDDWTTSLTPKVHGTKNLHNAFQGDLDFFIMLSSVSGTLGTPGQSNYASGNCYLDYLAQHRRSLGLPATSLVLPMIYGSGYVSEHPNIEKSLIQKGMYGISEREMLKGFELGITSQLTGPTQIILGMDPSRLSESEDDSGRFWSKDMRLSVIEASILARRGANGDGKASKRGSIASRLRQAAKSLPEDECTDLALSEITARLSRLLMMPVESFAGEKSLVYYGIDSVVGAEFRNWLFQEFALQTSFQKLLDQSVSLRSIATLSLDSVTAE